jgi:NAD+ diphosphatase
MAIRPLNPNTFANSPLDRAGHVRHDEAALAALRSNDNARVAVLRDGRPLVAPRAPTDAAQIAWLKAGQTEKLAHSVEIFLGLDGDVPLFAREATHLMDPREGGPLAGLGEFHELRSLLPFLPAGDAAILAQARALLDWHARHGFCAKCGNASVVSQAGYRRDCPACKAEHFPRTDPVVIMVGTCGDEALLGRGAQWPQHRFSALAGFLEPGETIEEAVARELEEEAGVRAVSVRYLFSQPWPFPSNLMIACLAEVADKTLKVDSDELAEARWFKKSELPQVLNGTHPDKFLGPPPFAVAHQLIKAWCET